MNDNAPAKNLTEEQHRAAALLAARLGGCTCEPTITIVRHSERVASATVAHDPDCLHASQLLARAAQAVRA